MKKGFTLIELMVASIIFAIITGTTFSILTISRRSWEINTNRVLIQQEIRRSMTSMLKEIRAASAIDPSTFAGGISDDFIRFTLQGQTVEYALAGNQLQRTDVTAGDTTIMANEINDVQFMLIGGDTIHIFLSAQKTTGLGHLLQASLNSQVLLRN